MADNPRSSTSDHDNQSTSRYIDSGTNTSRYTIMVWNINTLSSKIKAIEAKIEEELNGGRNPNFNYTDYDILCFLEVKYKQPKESDENLTGFTQRYREVLGRRDVGNPIGGIAVYVSNKIHDHISLITEVSNGSTSPEFLHFLKGYFLWLKVTKDAKDTYMCIVYAPGGGSSYWKKSYNNISNRDHISSRKHFFDYIAQCVQHMSSQGKMMILAGDFNMHSQDYQHRVSPDTRRSKVDKALFIYFIEKGELYIMNGRAHYRKNSDMTKNETTNGTDSVIDYAMVSWQYRNCLTDFKIHQSPDASLPSVLHRPLTFTVNVPTRMSYSIISSTPALLESLPPDASTSDPSSPPILTDLSEATSRKPIPFFSIKIWKNKATKKKNQLSDLKEHLIEKHADLLCLMDSFRNLNLEEEGYKQFKKINNESKLDTTIYKAYGIVCIQLQNDIEDTNLFERACMWLVLRKEESCYYKDIHICFISMKSVKKTEERSKILERTITQSKDSIVVLAGDMKRDFATELKEKVEGLHGEFKEGNDLNIFYNDDMITMIEHDVDGRGGQYASMTFKLKLDQDCQNLFDEPVHTGQVDDSGQSSCFH